MYGIICNWNIILTCWYLNLTVAVIKNKMLW
jgi:hypothetical protein